jgi:hypothetical protein
MLQNTVLVAVGYDSQTTILLCSVCEREPDREHLCVVCLGHHHAVILMPGCSAQLHLAGLGVLGCQAFRWFDSHMLDGVRVDLRANQRFDRIQKLFVTHYFEDRWPHPHRRLLVDIGIGQGKVEVLSMNLSRFPIDLGETFAKRQLSIGRRDFAFDVKFLGKTL